MIAGKQGCSPGHSSEEQSLVNLQCPVPSTTEDCGDAEEDGGAQKGPGGGAAPGQRRPRRGSLGGGGQDQHRPPHLRRRLSLGRTDVPPPMKTGATCPSGAAQGSRFPHLPQPTSSEQMAVSARARHCPEP